MDLDNRSIEHDFHTAFEAGRRQNIDVAVARVAYYRGITEEEVRQILKNVIRNIEDGNTITI